MTSMKKEKTKSLTPKRKEQLRAIADRRARVLRLYFIEGLSIEETARELGFSKSLIANDIKALRRMISAGLSKQTANATLFEMLLRIRGRQMKLLKISQKAEKENALAVAVMALKAAGLEDDRIIRILEAAGATELTSTDKFTFRLVFGEPVKGRELTEAEKEKLFGVSEIEVARKTVGLPETEGKENEAQENDDGY